VNYYKRILKTGALAAVVTIAFGVFAYRVAEWSRGINSEMAVPAQSNITCSAGPAGASGVLTTKVIPQIPIGSFDGGRTTYSTVIQIVNTATQSRSMLANFYKEDGTPLNNAALAAGDAMIVNGVLGTSIANDGVLVISGGGTVTTGVVAWGKITSCGGLSVSTFFELRDAANNVLYSRVGVAASPANMSRFVIPRIREVAAGLDVGFALVNTATSGTASLKAELKDEAGKTIATKDIPMAAGEHRAGFTRDLFAPLNETTGSSRSYQYVKFTSASPTFAAIALAFEGPTQTSFPADAIE
jgi:hypothetical protein